MRAVDIAILLLCLNAGFALVSGTEVWDSAGENQLPSGSTPQEVRDKLENSGETLENVEKYDEDAFGSQLPGPISDMLNSKISIGILLAGVILGGFSTRLAQLTTVQTVGIVGFTVMYSFLLAHTATILEAMLVPEILITIITGFNFFWLSAGIIQMATGASWEALQ